MEDVEVQEIDDLDIDDAAGSESAAATGDDKAGTGNAWDNIPKLSDLLEKADAAKSGKDSTDPTGDDTEDDDEAGSNGEREAATDKPDETKQKEGDDSEESEAKARNFTVRDDRGNTFDLDLEPGTTIAFKADGRDVEVTSLDELISYASKGVHADRKLSTMGQDVAKLRGENAALKTTSEELLIKALFDREARQALRKALAPFRDPEVRKGHEALAREAERTTQEKTQTEESIAEARDQFWTGVGRDLKAALPEFQYLTDEDAPEITRVFYANYETTFKQALEQEMAKPGATEEKAAAAAQAAAFKSLNQANLRSAMKSVHDRYEQRLGKPAKGTSEKPVGEKDAKKATEAHNRHTDTKLEQRRSAPRLRTAGAAPGAAPAKPPTPTTFKGREREIKGLFRTMRGEDK